MIRSLKFALVFAATILCGLPFAGCADAPPVEETRYALPLWSGNSTVWSGAQRGVPSPHTLQRAVGQWRPDDANSLGGPSGHYFTAAWLASPADFVAGGMVTTVVNTVRTQAPIAEWNGNRVSIPGCAVNDTHRYVFTLQQSGTSLIPGGNITVTIMDLSTFSFCGPGVTISRPGGGVPAFTSALWAVKKDPPFAIGRFANFSITSCAAKTWLGENAQPDTGDNTATYNMVASDGHHLIDATLPIAGAVTFTWIAGS